MPPSTSGTGVGVHGPILFVRRMLLERLSLRAIARITGVSRSWLQRFVNETYREETPWEPGELKAGSGKLVLEADEM